jgi:23S rRNA pseudouridine2604 synthase
LTSPTDSAKSSNEPIRISKILAQRGIASRTEADRMIERGWVSVDGRVAASGDRALPDAAITLSPEAQAQLKNAFTIILNKPRGFVSSPDETGGARAMGLLSPDSFCGVGNPPSIATYGLRVAGRLSVQESGLVVYTTDTALARRLAAKDVDETWQLDFADDSASDMSTRFVDALKAATLSATVVSAEAHTLILNTSSLDKSQLSDIASALAVRAAIKRLRRGEIALDDVPEGQWMMAG